MSATQAYHTGLLILGTLCVMMALAIVTDMVSAWRERRKR